MKLVLVRHGESLWNQENRFTGWTDVALSEKGIEEAKQAGKILKENQYTFSVAYTSVLKRAQDTLTLLLEEMHTSLPIFSSWKLNERHYGALQGLNKQETAEKYGEEQVKLWRRSTNVRPPSLTKEDERYPGNDLKYASLTEEELPLSENLIDTMNRVIPYYQEEIEPRLKNQEDVLIVAHGNSLRSLVKYLDQLTEEECIALEIPTGKPLVYEMDEEAKPCKHYYL